MWGSHFHSYTLNAPYYTALTLRRLSSHQTQTLKTQTRRSRSGSKLSQIPIASQIPSPLVSASPLCAFWCFLECYPFPGSPWCRRVRAAPGSCLTSSQINIIHTFAIYIWSSRFSELEFCGDCGGVGSSFHQRINRLIPGSASPCPCVLE